MGFKKELGINCRKSLKEKIFLFRWLKKQDKPSEKEIRQRTAINEYLEDYILNHFNDSLTPRNIMVPKNLEIKFEGKNIKISMDNVRDFCKKYHFRLGFVEDYGDEGLCSWVYGRYEMLDNKEVYNGKEEFSFYLIKIPLWFCLY